MKLASMAEAQPSLSNFISLLSGKKRLRSLKLLDMNSFMVFLPEGAFPEAR